MAVDVALDTRMDTMRRLVLVDAEATPWLGDGGDAHRPLGLSVFTPSHTLRESNPDGREDAGPAPPPYSASGT